MSVRPPGSPPLADAPTPAARAQAWLDGAPGPAGSPDLALAWALKDACYAAWSADPRRAARAADLLGEVVAQWPAEGQAGQTEARALAAWTRGIAHLTRGQMAEAIGALDEAAGHFVAGCRPDAAAQTQVPKVMALAMLGRHAEAAACAEATQAALVAAGDWLAAAKVSLNQGSLHLRHDAYALATRHYREAARLFARVQDHEHSVMADIGHADALTALGELDEAAGLYTRAGARAQAHALPVLLALADESAALLELSRGGYAAALAGLERARAAYERLGMPQHLAIAEKQLADAYLELRLLPEAMRLYAQAVPQFDALGMPDDKAWALAAWGRARALAGDATGAAAHLAAAHALFDGQGSGAGRAAVALARAELALQQGDPAAPALAEAAVRAQADAGSDDGRARAHLAHAQAQAAAGRWSEARAGFSRCLADARAQRRLAAEAHSLAGLAAADQALGSAGAARAGFEAATERFDELRHALPADELRSAALADHLQPYRALLALALADHAATPTPAHAAAVLAALDRVRARALSERLAAGAPPPHGDDAATRTLRARVSWLTRRARGLAEDDDTPSDTLRRELQAAEQALLERVRRQRLVAPPRPGPDPAAHAALNVAALQARLAPDEALVAYGESGGQWLACVARADRLSVHPGLAGAAELAAAVQAVRFQIDALGHGAAGGLQAHLPLLARRCEARLQALHGLLWAPLQAALAGARRVLLVAPPPLGALPFAALAGGVELAWAPSAASAAAGLARRPPAPGHALVLGEPSHLPHAGDEAREAAAAYPRARLHLGPAATVAALREGAAEAPAIHLACHAVFRADSPRFSALHLHDGALTAEQVETLPLRAAPVVVLSACDTAGQAGDAAGPPQGDEWLGLVRGFLVAGAARVVASLWPVDDAATRLFMARFHQALAGGATPAAALAAAQGALRSSHPHPFYWAAFALYGGW